MRQARKSQRKSAAEGAPPALMGRSAADRRVRLKLALRSARSPSVATTANQRERAPRPCAQTRGGDMDRASLVAGSRCNKWTSVIRSRPETSVSKHFQAENHPPSRESPAEDTACRADAGACSCAIADLPKRLHGPPTQHLADAAAARLPAAAAKHRRTKTASLQHHRLGLQCL